MKKRKTFNPSIQHLDDHEYLVCFGNTVGRVCSSVHRRFGAKDGVIEGFSGNTYMIPSYKFNEPVDSTYKEQPWYFTAKIKRLIYVAIKNPDKLFLVQYHGADCVMCKYDKEAMGKLFSVPFLPENIIFDQDFNNYVQ